MKFIKNINCDNQSVGRAPKTPRNKQSLDVDDQVAGPSRTPGSAAKKLAAFKASPKNGKSSTGWTTFYFYCYTRVQKKQNII